MTVKEFYNYCVEHEIADYRLDCYGITKFGDVSYRTALEPSMIHKDQDDKTIIFWEND
jgi:hypothetical protein